VKTVLIVDRSDVVRGVVRAIIEGAGFRVVEASSYETGYQLAQGSMDAILMDCMGDDGHGLATLKRLRASVSRAPTPVVAMCELNQCGTVLGQWADVMLVKPFRPAQLLLKLEAVLRAKSKHQNPSLVTPQPTFASLCYE
jgi:DNA-binding response OmpR family regulator